MEDIFFLLHQDRVGGGATFPQSQKRPTSPAVDLAVTYSADRGGYWNVPLTGYAAFYL